MKQSCEFEQSIAKAVRSGAWSEELRQHATGCESCAEVMLVAQFLQQEAQLAESEAKLPTANFLLWKTEIIQRQRASQQAARPVTWAVAIGVLLFVAVLAGGAFGIPQLRDLFTSQSGQTLFTMLASAVGGFGMAGFVAGTGALLAGSIYLARAR